MAHATTKWGAIALIPGGALLALALRGRDGAVPVHNAAAVLAHRAAIPAPPGKIVPYGKGVMYAGGDDKAHVAWLADFLTNLAGNESDLARRRGIMAFRALQGREGSTAAINTYDNQIVTWGTGWGGLGGLPKVLEHLSKSDAAAALQRGGFRYVGGGAYEVLNDKGERVHGKKEALEAVRNSPGLVRLLIHVARDPATRDDVALGQLWAFLGGSGRVEGQEEIATQALFNFASHLQHWAPGYARGGIAWAAEKAGGAGSRERDVRLAELLTQYFYTKARAKPGQWVPDWKQLRIYWNDMVRDGLAEAASHPYASAESAPAEAVDVAGGDWGVGARGESVFGLVDDLSDGHGAMLKALAAFAKAADAGRDDRPNIDALSKVLAWSRHKYGPEGLREENDRLVPWLVFVAPPWLGLEMKTWSQWQQELQNFIDRFAASTVSQYTEQSYKEADGFRRTFNEYAARFRQNGMGVPDIPARDLAPLVPVAPGAGTLAVLGGVTVLGLWLAARR